MFAGMPTHQKIRYGDCDAQAVVFNSNYSRFWDDAITDWFEDAGFGGVELGGIGVDVATVRTEIDFRAPAHLGDVLVTSPTVERLGNTSMSVGVETRRASDGALIVEGREVLVFLDPATRGPVSVPDELRQALS